jgi:hypothetical protein
MLPASSCGAKAPEKTDSLWPEVARAVGVAMLYTQVNVWPGQNVHWSKCGYVRKARSDCH